MDNFEAFNGNAAFPGYTLAELRKMVAEGSTNPKMIAEIARREAVAAGDLSRATPGERLRINRGK